MKESIQICYGVCHSMIKSSETCAKDEISKIIVRYAEAKKSEIRLKSENLHHCLKKQQISDP